MYNKRTILVKQEAYYCSHQIPSHKAHNFNFSSVPLKAKGLGNWTSPANLDK